MNYYQLVFRLKRRMLSLQTNKKADSLITCNTLLIITQFNNIYCDFGIYYFSLK